jgi:hypothetical protein
MSVEGGAIRKRVASPFLADTAAANRLVVEAAALIQRSDSTSDSAQKYTLLDEALKKLDEIVARQTGQKTATMAAMEAVIRGIPV